MSKSLYLFRFFEFSDFLQLEELKLKELSCNCQTRVGRVPLYSKNLTKNRF